MQALFAKSDAQAAESIDPCGFDFRTRIVISLVISTVTVFLSDAVILTVLSAVSLLYLVMSTRKFKIVAGAYILMALMSILSILVIIAAYELIGVFVEGTKAASSFKMMRTAVLGDFHTPFLRTLPSMNVILALVLNLSVQKFTGTLKALRMPRAVFLPLMVFFRFVPEFLAVVRQLRDAARMRGYSLSFGSALLHPFQTVRLTVIPLVFKTLAMGDNLAMASEMKRVGYARNPAHLKEMVFRRRDWIVCAFTCALLAGMVFWQTTIPQRSAFFGVSSQESKEVSK